MLVCVYHCQNTTLLEITCHGSYVFKMDAVDCRLADLIDVYEQINCGEQQRVL